MGPQPWWAAGLAIPALILTRRSSKSKPKRAEDSLDGRCASGLMTDDRRTWSAGIVVRCNATRMTLMCAVRRSEEGSDPTFVCERVCTSDRLLRRMGGLSVDPTPNTCVTVCGISGQCTYSAWTRENHSSLPLLQLTSAPPGKLPHAEMAK